MAELRPVYLLWGDDDAKLDAWRGRMRARAELEGGAGALERFDARADGPVEVAAALATLTFGAGGRYLLVDGVEAWKAGELEPLERALAEPAPATVLVLIARGKAPARLAQTVEGAGGELREYAAPRPWEMPRWVVERAREAGLVLDPEAAKALVAALGTRQQRLARELEKLALAAHPRARLTAEVVEGLAAGDHPRQVYDLADALVAGDERATIAIAEDLRGRDERPAALVYPVVRRLREVLRAAELLDAGVARKELPSRLRVPPWAVKRTVAQASKADRAALERALCSLADLEVEVRGGGDLDEDTALTLALVGRSR